MKTALAYFMAISASLAAHVALAAFLLVGSDPDPLEADPQSFGKIKMEAYEVSQTQADAQENHGEDAAAQTAEGENLAQTGMRKERAAAINATGERAAAQTPEPDQTAALPPPSEIVAPTQSAETVVAATKASGAETPALFAQGAVIAAASVAADVAPIITAITEPVQAVETQQPAQQAVAAKSAMLVAAAAPPAAALKPADAQAITLASANADIETMAAIAPRAGPVAASPIIGENTGQISPDAPLAVPTAPPSNPVAQTNSNDAAVHLTSAEPQTDNLLAVTSFAGNDGAPFDPVSYAAVASFMRPSSTADSADNARDSISQLLSRVPCARVAATFNPETGALELRGHVPNGDMRGPIVEAIRAQLGGSIPVSGSMLVLPEPQCNVLDDLEDIGLPQSVDQTNDSLQVGASTQLVTLDYGAGDTVLIPLQGSEFASYFYLDFYQVDGNVFHMLPNEFTPLELLQPDDLRNIGDDPDGLTLIVQPPYGMELVVAYSSSVPLYEGVRDIVEPSEPYLAFIQERVAQLREQHDDYKGEWVYMFVQTHGALD